MKLGFRSIQERKWITITLRFPKINSFFVACGRISKESCHQDFIQDQEREPQQEMGQSSFIYQPICFKSKMVNLVTIGAHVTIFFEDQFKSFEYNIFLSCKFNHAR